MSESEPDHEPEVVPGEQSLRFQRNALLVFEVPKGAGP